eukprot:g5924.t1
MKDLYSRDVQSSTFPSRQSDQTAPNLGTGSTGNTIASTEIGGDDVEMEERYETNPVEFTPREAFRQDTPTTLFTAPRLWATDNQIQSSFSRPESSNNPFRSYFPQVSAERTPNSFLSAQPSSGSSRYPFTPNHSLAGTAPFQFTFPNSSTRSNSSQNASVQPLTGGKPSQLESNPSLVVATPSQYAAGPLLTGGNPSQSASSQPADGVRDAPDQQETRGNTFQGPFAHLFTGNDRLQSTPPAPVTGSTPFQTPGSTQQTGGNSNRSTPSQSYRNTPPDQITISTPLAATTQVKEQDVPQDAPLLPYPVFRSSWPSYSGQTSATQPFQSFVGNRDSVSFLSTFGRDDSSEQMVSRTNPFIFSASSSNTANQFSQSSNPLFQSSNWEAPSSSPYSYGPSAQHGLSTSQTQPMARSLGNPWFSSGGSGGSGMSQGGLFGKNSSSLEGRFSQEVCDRRLQAAVQSTPATGLFAPPLSHASIQGSLLFENYQQSSRATDPRLGSQSFTSVHQTGLGVDSPDSNAMRTDEVSSPDKPTLIRDKTRFPECSQNSPDSDVMRPEQLNSPPKNTSAQGEMGTTGSFKSLLHPDRSGVPFNMSSNPFNLTPFPQEESNDRSGQPLERITEAMHESETDIERNGTSPDKQTELAPPTHDKRTEENTDDGRTEVEMEKQSEVQAEERTEEITQEEAPAHEKETTEGNQSETIQGEESTVSEPVSEALVTVPNQKQPAAPEREVLVEKEAEESVAVQNEKTMKNWSKRLKEQLKRNRTAAEAKILAELFEEETERARELASRLTCSSADKEYLEYEREFRRCEFRYKELSKTHTYRSVDGLSEEQVDKFLPIVESDDYYYKPNPCVLRDMVCATGVAGLKRTPGFVIARKGFGKVEFELPIDITRMEINKTVEISRGSLDFISNLDQFESIPMTVTLYKVFDEEALDMYEKTMDKLEDYCMDMGHEMVSYDEDGTWVFRIYGIKS